MNRPFKFRYASELAGTFVVLAALALAAGVFAAARYQGWFEGTFMLRSRFSTEAGAHGLQEGNEVRIRNTLAGRVGEVVPTEDGGLETRFVIKNRFKPLVRKDSVAKVKMKFGLAGDAFVEIAMGTGAPAEDGDMIECRKDEEIMDTARKALEDIRSVTVPMLEQVQGILSNVNAITRSIDQGRGLAGTLVNDPSFSLSIRSAVDNIGDAATDAQEAIEETTRLVKGIQRHWLFRSYVDEDGRGEFLLPGYLGRGESRRVAREALEELELARKANDRYKGFRSACLLAACLIGEGQSDAAGVYLAEALADAGEGSRDAVPVFVLQAERARAGGRADEAVALAGRAVKALGGSSTEAQKVAARVVLANAWLDAGRREEARKEFKEARWEVGRKSPAYLRGLVAELDGRLHAVQGTAKPAMEAYDTAARLMGEAGLFHGVAGCLAKAAAACEAGRDPSGAADRYYRAGRSLFAAGAPDEARRDLDKALPLAKAAGDVARVELIAALQKQVSADAEGRGQKAEGRGQKAEVRGTSF